MLRELVSLNAFVLFCFTFVFCKSSSQGKLINIGIF